MSVPEMTGAGVPPNTTNAKGPTGESIDRYSQAEKDRNASTQVILNSKARKKIVVAGPGTGKTFLFRQVLEGKGKALTLTFINALVEDLSLELRGSSKSLEIRTLHGFARSILAQAYGKEIKISPKLSEVIKEDIQILTGKNVNFDQLFRNRNDKDPAVVQYKQRRVYYEHYGYTDVVSEAVQYLEQNEEAIPQYEQVLVDEFQDFNLLEVALIELLAKKNSLLLAGDDDQALYPFKDASCNFIRERYSQRNLGYEPHTLPFCSRCTRAIVDATNDIIRNAQGKGLLGGRITKPYKFFEDKDKEVENQKYPTIIYTQCFETQMAWLISQKISEAADQEKKLFTILIITPTREKCRFIAEALRRKGFGNIEFSEKTDNDSPCLLDGLKLLLEDDKSNLGWRIVAKHLMKPDEFQVVLKGTNVGTPKRVVELVDKKNSKEVSRMLKALRGIRDAKSVVEEEMTSVLKAVGRDPSAMTGEIVRKELTSIRGGGEPGIRKLPIKITTIQGSKGLDGDIVFISHFDDLYYIKDKDKKKITNLDVCNFVVALTRARKKVVLVSSRKSEPTFLKWIEQKRVTRL